MLPSKIKRRYRRDVHECVVFATQRPEDLVRRTRDVVDGVCVAGTDKVIAQLVLVHRVEMERIVRIAGCPFASIDDGIVAILDVNVIGSAPLKDGVLGLDIDLLDEAVPHILVPETTIDATSGANIEWYWLKDNDQCGALRCKAKFMQICGAIVASTYLMDGVIRRVDLMRVSDA